MFTGIIQKLGKLAEIKKSGQEQSWLVDTAFNDLSLGESVALNGVCLTVTSTTPKGLAQFFLSSETLEKTQLKTLSVGDTLNLERALALGDRLSGHIVQGHVDTIATLQSITPLDQSFDLEIKMPTSLLRYCIEKGSITLDGVSLTINSIKNDSIFIRVIPHTWTHTRFHTLKKGALLNVEVDLIAKYAEKLCQPYIQP
jgi:riboflavin synthase